MMYEVIVTEERGGLAMVSKARLRGNFGSVPETSVRA